MMPLGTRVAGNQSN